MSQSDNKQAGEEIDLTAISKGIGGFFQNLSTWIFRTIQFVIKNAILISVLIVIGAGIGIYLDKTQKSFENRLVVVANFNSVDYLYSKIDLLNSKIKKSDTVFLKNIGIAIPDNIKSIDIKPVIDVYGFVNRSEHNFDMVKLMSENGDLKKVIEESPTSKNYPFHMITFSAKAAVGDRNTVDPIMKFLNNSDYFRLIQKEAIVNIKNKIQANDTIIHQIDGVLNGMSANSGQNGKTIYINENTQLNDVIETKERLVREQGENRISLINTDQIIKKCSQTLNIQKDASINGNLKIILPVLFILLFAALHAFRAFYRKQSLKAQQG